MVFKIGPFNELLKKRFKVLKVGPRLNYDDVIINLIII